MTLDLKRIKARCEAATKGLWEVVYAHGWALGVGVDMSKPGTILQAFEMIGNTLRKNTPDTRAAQRQIDRNAQFIAYAHKDLPACITEIERLQKAVEASKCCLAFSMDECDRDIDCKDCEGYGYPAAVKEALEQDERTNHVRPAMLPMPKMR